MRTASLGFFLVVLWLLLSGHYDALMIGLGLASCALVLFFAGRMGSLDEEAHPVHLLRGVLTYLPWLAWQIVKSNIDVAKIVLSPKLPIAPNLITVKASQASDVGRVVYANSITLTPGTVSIVLEDDAITVHGLNQAFSDDVVEGEMDRRVTASMEG